MSKAKPIQTDEPDSVKLDPSTIMFRPPTKKQLAIAERRKVDFAKWEDSLRQKPKADQISPKDATSAGDAVRAWYASKNKGR